ncbi:MAG: hypothetical protein KJZ86_09275 [Caldilineaceae bacterium]|nr:hypothetical protein [Caldilineaceae bacterium]HRJ41948.1 mannosyltransferase family protein [Caldilineaceae bacterium]
MLPFVITRLSLLIVGWFAQYLPPNPYYPLQEAIARGWQFSPFRLLDIWGRWDAGWYLSIVRAGYLVRGEIGLVQSNVAFFPLYPYTVKLFALFIPERLQTPGALLLVGLLVSNTFLLSALYLLRNLTVSLFDESIARKSVWYILLFPTGFFFSCFYAESAFLLFAVATFYFAHRRAWMAAGVAGFLLTLTRPLGVLIVIPVLWMYWESFDRRWRLPDRNVAWIFLIPVGILLHFWNIYTITGDFWAPIHVQQAWNRNWAMPWETILTPVDAHPYILPIEQVATIAFLIFGVISFVVMPSASYGLFILLSMIPILLSGTLMSSVRYYGVLFPFFLVLARMRKGRFLEGLLITSFATIQIAFMIAWSQFYWVE